MNMRTALKQCGSKLTPLSDGWQRTYSFSKQSPVFNGHFTKRAILPAVIQCLMAELCLEDIIGAHATIQRIHDAKFLAVVEPDCTVHVAIIPGRKPGAYVCTLTADATLAAKITVYTTEVMS